jgi:hypothetical protein
MDLINEITKDIMDRHLKSINWDAGDLDALEDNIKIGLERLKSELTTKIN